MIVKAIQPDGTPRYFNAFTGKQVKLPRYQGGKTGRLPAEALRFLSPAMPSPIQPISEPLQQRMERRNEQRAFGDLNKVNLNVKLSWFKRFYNWMKSKING